jgi:hypothetical protein
MGADKNVLHVRVNDELTLDAGWWEEHRDEDGNVQRYVHPPRKTMFEQIIAYLESLLPIPGYPGLRLGEEAIAATAVCLRWGSYLAVLADRDKPLWPQARHPTLGRITDDEMARINVEASAALAQWIDLMRDDYWGHYLQLMWAASRLPMTRKSVRTKREIPFMGLTYPDAAAELIQAAESIQSRSNGGGQARAEAEAYPSRVLANTIINACWRTGPVESIHAGEAPPLPLLQRRITPSEERTLVRHTAGHMARAIFAVCALINEESDRSWAERVLPFNLDPLWLKPQNWSLDEQTRQVWLAGAEPAPD